VTFEITESQVGREEIVWLLMRGFMMRSLRDLATDDLTIGEAVMRDEEDKITVNTPSSK